MALAREAAAEAQSQACREAGFVEGTDAFRLCRQLADVQARLAGVERRLDRLELDAWRPFPYGGAPFGFP